MIRESLSSLREEEELDFVVANYENASHGFGLSEKNARELFGAGIDVMTGGNHTWDKKEIKGLLETMPLLRPAKMCAASGWRSSTLWVTSPCRWWTTPLSVPTA